MVDFGGELQSQRGSSSLGWKHFNFLRRFNTVRSSSSLLTILVSPLGRKGSSPQERSCLDPKVMDECQMGSVNQGSIFCPARHKDDALSWGYGKGLI